MYKEHPVFQKPVDSEIKIWRYLDFTKYISLLESQALFFSRADKMNDTFEGSYGSYNANVREAIYKDIPAEKLKEISTFNKTMPRWTALNCWHMNEHESAAMWKLYLQANEGVAIRSTFQKLCESFKSAERDIYIGMVKYVDYQNEWIPEGNTFWPFVHKRRSFEHEKELRAIIQHLPVDGEGISKDFYTTGLPGGVTVPVNLQTLIEAVHVAPTSPKWFHDLVVKLALKYNLGVTVLQSSLSQDPIF